MEVDLNRDVNQRGGLIAAEYEYLKAVTNAVNTLPAKALESDLQL